MTLTLSPSSRKRLHRAHLHVVIVIVDAGPDLDLLDLDDLLLLAGLVLLLLGLVFELAEIEDLADRRIGIGRDLDQIEAGLGGHVERFARGDDPDHLAVFLDKSDARHGDLGVDARPVAGRGGIERRSGYRRTPLIVRPAPARRFIHTNHGSGQAHRPRGRARLRLQSIDGLPQRKDFLLLPQAAQRHAAVLGLALADHQHDRNFAPGECSRTL